MHLNFGSYDPTREFPDDNRVQGFASVGEKLVTSSFLMRQYLEAADELIERAVHFEPQPEVRRWDLSPPFDRTTGGFINGEAGYFRDVAKQPQPYQSLCERMRGLPKGGYHPIDDLRDGVPVGGWYKIRIQAEAKFRYANLDPKKMQFPSLWDPAAAAAVVALDVHAGRHRSGGQGLARLRRHSIISSGSKKWPLGTCPTTSRPGWSAGSGSTRAIFRGSAFPTGRPTATIAC